MNIGGYHQERNSRNAFACDRGRARLPRRRRQAGVGEPGPRGGHNHQYQLPPRFRRINRIASMYSADGQNIFAAALVGCGAGRSSTIVLRVGGGGYPDAPTPRAVRPLALCITSPLRSARSRRTLPGEPVVASIGNAAQGKNSSLKIGWTGMAPPKGDIAHRYVFQLFALDATP